MVVIREVSATKIKDSRGDETIFISIKTEKGLEFSASAPNGKSRGKKEAKPYKKDLEGDIKTLKKFSDYFSEDILERFEDLRRVEDILDRQVGGNTIIALECAILKAIAFEEKKEIWEIINPSAKKFPRFVGNCIGGGKHSSCERKPDFQEFLVIPNEKSAKKNFERMKKIKEDVKIYLKEKAKNFSGEKNDEDAWMTSLNEREVLDILSREKVDLGVDIAASSFYKRKKYLYENPLLKRTPEEQLGYLNNLVRNFNLFYVEDPFEEDDFESFGKLLGKAKNSLIVGDDLTVTNVKRLEKAIKEKSVNALIVKPNQVGSLIEVKKVVELAREKNVKIVFSHRSGETDESILADLAFGFGADFLKCGITGREREVKIKRLIEIEKSLKKI